nr:hypothetical protein [Nitrospinota bacterium]
MAKKLEVTPPPAEFTGRISRLLLSLIQGTKQTLAENDKLSVQLNEMAAVIQKGVRVTPPTDLDKEILEYFDRLILEKDFVGGEKDMVK